MGDRKTIQKRLQRARWRVGRDYRQHEAALTEAAQFFRLDPNKPDEREQLLYALADAVFGPPGKKGRRKGTRPSWGHRLLLLGRIYDDIKREKPKLSEIRIAQLICQRHKEFENDDPEQVRQRLKEARWTHEIYWEKGYDALLDAAHDAYVEKARADYIAEHGKEPDEDWEPEPPEPEWND